MQTDITLDVRVYIQNCLGYNVTGQRKTPIRQPRSINHSRKDPLYTWTKSVKKMGMIFIVSPFNKKGCLNGVSFLAQGRCCNFMQVCTFLATISICLSWNVSIKFL